VVSIDRYWSGTVALGIFVSLDSAVVFNLHISVSDESTSKSRMLIKE